VAAAPAAELQGGSDVKEPHNWFVEPPHETGIEVKLAV